MMQPVFSFGDGIVWRVSQLEPWIQLGVNVLSMLSIILWAGVHAAALFGGLKYIGVLRVDEETELRGCDMIKHGEDSYPASAWKNLNLDVSTQTALLANTRREAVYENGKDTVYERGRINPNRRHNNSYNDAISDSDINDISMENFRSVLNICKEDLKI